MSYCYNLQSIMNELGIEKSYHLTMLTNKKVRPQTIDSLVEGKTLRLELDTIHTLLDALNKVANERGLDKTYTIDSLITYVKD
ncbi:XRE family transcriptional regulator [Niallia taxi]|uniref:XRE family transcriptional regulator n=1 Tax=Niallia taxi TaxID=2499688 RepID=UPI0015F3F35A|nr:XRE family transcriptional regulator [Niallia taxi]